jgi:hypothetical protein
MARVRFESEVTAILRRYGRNWAYSERIERIHDRSVQDFLAAQLCERQYTTPSGSIRLGFDWQSAYAGISENTDLSLQEWLDLPESRRPREAISEPMRLTIYCVEESLGRKPIDPTPYVELALYDVFLIANISTPGAFSSRHVTIEHDGHSLDRLVLDALFFEDAEYTASARGWPEIRVIPIDRVAQWYLDLELGTQQLATTRIAKALFSVLHLVQLNATEPAVVIWLAQCLESLYAVPPSLSFNFLVSRSESLLGAAPKRKWFRSEWRRFVEARNVFVHGGSDVVHPMTDERFDPNVKDLFWKWIEPSDFAASVVLATLQRYADNRWRDVEWREDLVPEILGGA